MAVPYGVVVRMHESEWSSDDGGVRMQTIAREILSRPNPPAVVEVREHAGWWMSFAVSLSTSVRWWEQPGAVVGELVCVGSANDLWQPPQEVLAFWGWVRACGLKSTPWEERTEADVERSAKVGRAHRNCFQAEYTAQRLRWVSYSDARCVQRRALLSRADARISRRYARLESLLTASA